MYPRSVTVPALNCAVIVRFRVAVCFACLSRYTGTATAFHAPCGAVRGVAPGVLHRRGPACPLPARTCLLSRLGAHHSHRCYRSEISDRPAQTALSGSVKFHEKCQIHGPALHCFRRRLARSFVFLFRGSAQRLHQAPQHLRDVASVWLSVFDEWRIFRLLSWLFGQFGYQRQSSHQP